MLEREIKVAKVGRPYRSIENSIQTPAYPPPPGLAQMATDSKPEACNRVDIAMDKMALLT